MTDAANFTFREVETLEAELFRLGEAMIAEVSDARLARIAQWFEEQQTGLTRGWAEIVVELCSYVRVGTEQRCRKIALGALVVAQRDLAPNPAKAAFSLRYASYRIREIDPRAEATTLGLKPAEELDAEAFFDAALTDRSMADSAIEKAAETLITSRLGEMSIQGRMAGDAAYLLEVWRSTAEDETRKRVARAALAYLAEPDDAIPDSFGVIGFLDDALVLQKAVNRLQPERAFLLSIIQDIVSTWPCLRHLALDWADARYPVSEVLAVLVGLLSTAPEVSSSKVAVVLPNAGPFAFVVGFIRSLVQLQKRAGAAVFYGAGERLKLREGRAEIRFLGYFRRAGTEFVACEPEAATHFRFESLRKRTAAGCTETGLIAGLSAFERSKKEEGDLTSGRINLDAAKARVGPLEQLFGSHTPISFPSEQRVLVVDEMGRSKDLAGSLTINGTLVRDLFPMGHARVDSSGTTETNWGAKGGSQLLCLTPNAADALAISQGNSDVVACVASVGADARDVPYLSDIAERVPTVVLVEQRNSEAWLALEQRGFKFWVLDERWAKTFRWPMLRAVHPLRKLEQDLSCSSTARVDHRTIELGGIAAAGRELLSIQPLLSDEHSDALKRAVYESMGILLAICRTVGPVSPGQTKQIDAQIATLEKLVRLNANFWTEEFVIAMRNIVQGFSAAAAALNQQNPKFAGLQSWFAEHGNCQVFCSPRIQHALSAAGLPSHVHLITNSEEIDPDLPAIVPAWLRRRAMERILRPPIVRHTTVLTYPPEAIWFTGFVRQTALQQERLGSLDETRPAFRRALPKLPARRSPAVVQQQVPLTDPEQASEQLRSALTSSRLAAETEDTVAACVVHFAGGVWAAFPIRRNLNVLSYEPGCPEDATISQKKVRELEQGDLLVLLRSSDRDALRSIVDRTVPPEVRETAALWQRALRGWMDSGYTVDEAAARLRKAGCEVSSETIERWYSDDSMLGPRASKDIERIGKVTQDSRLAAELHACIESVSALRGEHLRAAKQLARAALARTRQWLDIGAKPDELVSLDDGFVVVAVEVVESGAKQVPKSLLSQLQDY